MSRTLSGSQSDSSGSSASDEIPQPHYIQQRPPAQPHEPEVFADEVEYEAPQHTIPPIRSPALASVHRPPSSVSSNRYRTPMAGSLLASSPPPAMPVLPRVPETQPLPGFETPSAFAEPSSGSSFIPSFADLSRGNLTSPPNMYPAQPQYRDSMQTVSSRTHGGGVPSRPISRPTLEHAVENVQAHLAALSERMESLESLHLSRSGASPGHAVPGGSPAWRGSPGGRRNGNNQRQWDLDDLGMWSLVAQPISRGIESLREAATFFARDENRTPMMIIVRRLCLDISFLVCVLAVIRALWRKSGVRRREVKAALGILWRAILGTKPPRAMVDRGV
uniref:Uncharacterized protein n=1 Tax=Mycena chlorophos TaxID=658473 RepID=A0ABQ0LRZ3_MYCCL|nr:predicted protein [Mycena chlorophos]GAT53844.1 predicted protein [Mycena chlorophos]